MYVCTKVAKAWFAESLLRSLKIAYRREGPIPVAEIYCQYYMFISCNWDRRPVYTSCTCTCNHALTYGSPCSISLVACYVMTLDLHFIQSLLMKWIIYLWGAALNFTIWGPISSFIMQIIVYTCRMLKLGLFVIISSSRGHSELYHYKAFPQLGYSVLCLGREPGLVRVIVRLWFTKASFVSSGLARSGWNVAARFQSGWVECAFVSVRPGTKIDPEPLVSLFPVSTVRKEPDLIPSGSVPAPCLHDASTRRRSRGDGGAARGDHGAARGDRGAAWGDGNPTSSPFLVLLAGDSLALPFVLVLSPSSRVL